MHISNNYAGGFREIHIDDDDLSQRSRVGANIRETTMLSSKQSQRSGKDRYLPNITGSQFQSNYGDESVTAASTKDAWSVMDSTMDKVLGYREGLNQIKIKEVIGAIDRDQGHSELKNYYHKAKEENKMENKGFQIEAPMMGFNGTEYGRIKQEEKELSKPKANTPMTILHERQLKQFLHDQRKVKNAEQRWFDKLEVELERMEMDEQIHDYISPSEKAASTQNILRGDGLEDNESIPMNEIQPVSSDFEISPQKETAIAVIPEKEYKASDYGLNFDLDIVKSCIK